MILESLILLAFIALLAALFHFKIKNIATRRIQPETATDETSSRPAPERTAQSLAPAPGTSLQERPRLDKLNQTNPQAMANLITHWVTEPPPEPKKSYMKR